MTPVPVHKLSKLESRIVGALIILLLSLGFMAVLLNRNGNLIKSANAKLESSEKTKFDIQQIVSVSTDLETGTRGYIITGDEKYLEPTNRAIRVIFSHLDHLRTVEAGNEAQLIMTKTLDSLVDKKVSVTNNEIDIRKNKGLDAAIIIYASSGEEKKLMDKIRSVTDRMIVTEELSLKAKTENYEQSYKDFNWVFNLLLGIVAIMVVSLFFIISYYLSSLTKAERDLRVSNNFLNAIIENIPDMVFIKDAKDLRFVMFNKAAEKLLGHSRHKIIGKTDHDIFPAEQADLFMRNDREVLNKKLLMNTIEEPMDTSNGKRWFNTKKIIITNKNETPMYLMGISEDITERRLIAETENKELHEIYDLFNSAPCGYLSTDPNGIVVEMNDTFLKWLQYTRMEVIGKMPTKNLLAEDSLDIFNYYFPRIRSNKMKFVHDLEIRYKRKDNTCFTALINVVGKYDPEGNFIKTKTSIFDISIQRKAQSLITQN